MSALLYFLLWGAFFFVMMRFGCGAPVMGHGRSHAVKVPNTAQPPGGAAGFSGRPAFTQSK